MLADGKRGGPRRTSGPNPTTRTWGRGTNRNRSAVSVGLETSGPGFVAPRRERSFSKDSKTTTWASTGQHDSLVSSSKTSVDPSRTHARSARPHSGFAAQISVRPTPTPAGSEATVREPGESRRREEKRRGATRRRTDGKGRQGGRAIFPGTINALQGELDSGKQFA